MQSRSVAPSARDIQHRKTHGGGEFVIEQEGQRLAELTYSLTPQNVANITHTWVRPDLRAQGIARKLVDAAVAWARTASLRVRPICSYARAVLSRDASAADILV